MTAEEAIKTIEIAIAEVEWEYPMEYAVAFETAIEALEKIEEYKRLEEQGLLLRLPCKVGDTIYEIVNGKIKEFCFYNTWRIARYLETGIFGEYAFLTREEAEAKLKEVGE